MSSLTIISQELNKIESLLVSDTIDFQDLANRTLEIYETARASLIDLINSRETSKTIKTITIELFSHKNHLAEETQKKIVRLFLKIHDMQPVVVENLDSLPTPVFEEVQKYKGSAIRPKQQQYPIRKDLLVKEKMPCNEYFKPMTMQFSDGSKTNVSQGLLFRFSEMVRKMIKHNEMKTEPNRLVLEMLNHHQFDTLICFLETGEHSLINEENILALLHAGTYLQMPQLIEGCNKFILNHPSPMTVISALNIVTREENHEFVSALEALLSEHIKSLLFSEGGERELNNVAQQLHIPITLNLSGIAIEKPHLEMIAKLPISQLSIRRCHKLTNDSLTCTLDARSEGSC